MITLWENMTFLLPRLVPKGGDIPYRVIDREYRYEIETINDFSPEVALVLVRDDTLP